VDVGTIVENFRATVVDDISRQIASAQRKFAARTARQLVAVFKDRPAELRSELVRVMTFGGRDTAQVKTELTKIEEQAEILRVPLEMLLAQRLAQADLAEAARLVGDAAPGPGSGA
jgi:hypothetical protein